MRAAVSCVCPPGAPAASPLAVPTPLSRACRAWRARRRKRAPPCPAFWAPSALLRAQTLLLCCTCIPRSLAWRSAQQLLAVTDEAPRAP